MRFDLYTLGFGGVLRRRIRRCGVRGGSIDGDDTFDDADGASFAEFFAEFFDSLRVHSEYLRVEPDDGVGEVAVPWACTFRCPRELAVAWKMGENKTIGRGGVEVDDFCLQGTIGRRQCEWTERKQPSWSVKTGIANLVRGAKQGEVSALYQPCDIAGERYKWHAVAGS